MRKEQAICSQEQAIIPKGIPLIIGLVLLLFSDYAMTPAYTSMKQITASVFG